MYEDNISAQYCLKTNAKCELCDNYRFYFKDSGEKCQMQKSLENEFRLREIAQRVKQLSLLN